MHKTSHVNPASFTERMKQLKAIAYMVKCKSFSCPQYGFVKNYVDIDPLQLFR